ncbi:TIR domain-containing protein [Planococcus alpniumensis]|uniref:TIR domain-containing protein n=1 Tax=Planococcus alpniumensis TaxID=2708345 RepID=UPI001B8D815A|nr:TIR domain-containing protein [Planococcus sp. MSAK28401]
MFSTISDVKNKIIENSREKTTYLHPIESPEEVAKLIVAYSNSDGGDLVFGIRDDGKRLEVKSFPFKYDLQSVLELIEGTIDIQSAKFNLNDAKLFYISINKADELVKVNKTIYRIDNCGRAEEIKNQKIFISYCWSDQAFADLIDNDFKTMGYSLTRDIRDIEFKDSIKDFMKTIGKHDFVISIVSDNYLKSVNCMYEISEVMRSREYKEKMLLIILKESDRKFLPSPVEVTSVFATNIYSLEQRIDYISYWEEKEAAYLKMIRKITQDTNKIEALQELKRIENISRNVSEFLSEISDWSNTNLSELKASNYSAFTKEINK